MKTRIISLFDFLVKCHSKKVLFSYDTNKSMSGMLTFNYHDHPFEFYVHDFSFSLRRNSVKNYNSIQSDCFIWDNDWTKEFIKSNGYRNLQETTILGVDISKNLGLVDTKYPGRGIVEFLEENL